jgi:NAD(P)-dependent dehydrogenase (short-subunit alcohol dehydrogenase family)
MMKFLLFFILALSLNAAEAKKVVLITGASRGVGLATAEYLAKKGFHVYAGVRNKASLKSTRNLHFEILDVTDLSTIQKTVSTIIEKEGRLDILINNAGYALGGPVESLSMPEIKAQYDVNFFGVVRMCQEVLPHMRKQQKGHIINISSEQGIYGLPYGSSYTSSKAALESLSEALSIEVSPWNIHVSIIEPGLISTKFSILMGSRKVDGNPYKKIVDEIESSLLQRYEHPESLNPSQSPQEIAQFLWAVIQDPDPQLRYQTSAAAKEMVSLKLLDLTGKEYTKIMKKGLEHEK